MNPNYSKITNNSPPINICMVIMKAMNFSLTFSFMLNNPNINKTFKGAITFRMNSVTINISNI